MTTTKTTTATTATGIPGSPMPVGVRMPLISGGLRREEYTSIAVAAVELGYRALWVGDHVVPPTTQQDPYPYTETHAPPAVPDSPWLDPFVAMTWLASVTPPDVRLGTSVYLLPLRNTILVAKQLMSLSWFAGREISFGLGSGWFRAEYETVGAPFDGRANRVQQQIVELRDLVRTGRFPEHPTVELTEMKPPLSAPVRMLWGGYSDLALKIVARHCDGWIPTKCTFDQLAERRAVLAQRCEEEGRDIASLHLVAKPGPGPFPGPERIDRASLARYAELGFDEAVLELPLNPPSAGECMAILEQVSKGIGA